METPTFPGTIDASELPALALLVDAASALFDLAHTAAIAELVRRSYEHTYSLSQYAKYAVPSSLATFERYGASAFDEGTVQDLKCHREADEIYLALEGTFRILWKPKKSPKLQQGGVIEVSAQSSPWAFIPAGYCLLVARDPDQPFLAVAFKTKESNIKNGGKQLGEKCENYKTCEHGKSASNSG